MSASSRESVTRTDRWIRALRDHPTLSVLIVVATTVIAVGQLTGTLDHWRRIIWPPDVEKTYAQVKYDLLAFDQSVEPLRTQRPPIGPISRDDSLFFVFSLRQAAQAAQQVCVHRSPLTALDDSVGVQWVTTVCKHGNYIRMIDSLNTAYPDSGFFAAGQFLILQVQTVGVRELVRDSAGALLRGEWRRRRF
jgi:hypothetical protein